MAGWEFILAGLLLSVSATAEPVERTFWLRDYPTTAAECHDAAARFRDAFAAATGVETLSGMCEPGESSQAFHINIQYRSEQPVPAVNTADSRTGGIYPLGRYKKREQCDGDLPAKVAEFESATGLTPIFSYCFPDALAHRSPWGIRIVGFGQPRLLPWVSGYQLFSVPKELTKAELIGGISGAMATKGHVFSDAVIHSSLAYATASVHYYADKRLTFEMIEYTKTAKLEGCKDQVAEIKAAFQGTANPPALLYCGYVHVGGYFETNALFIGKPGLRSRLSLEQYSKAVACEEARPGLVETYRQKLKLDVRWSSCTATAERNYRVFMLYP